MITKEQYHEAFQANILQENLLYFEKQLAKYPKRKEFEELEALIASSKKELKGLTGNERGFLDDRPL